MNADFFRNAGLFAVEDFLDARSCISLRAEARNAPQQQATVGERDRLTVDEETRRTKSLKLSEESVAIVQERILDARPDMERHFKISLSGCQKPQFLSYKPGDFYARHRDLSSRVDVPEFIRQRKLSVVIFLNGEGVETVPDSYSGGALTFFGLLQDPRLNSKGFPLTGQQGLLIAFPSHLIHEVQPVTRGERFTVASWLY